MGLGNGRDESQEKSLQTQWKICVGSPRCSGRSSSYTGDNGMRRDISCPAVGFDDVTR